MNGVVVVLDKMIYNCDPNKHTVTYAKYCEEIGQRENFLQWEASIKAVVAPDLETGIKMLRKSLQVLLAQYWFEPKAVDFRFSVRHSEIKDGRFWLVPSTIVCKDYLVVGETL